MTNEEKKQLVLRAMSMADGDDLERANAAFGRMNDQQLDEQWGASGKTCREIWDGYKQSRARNREARSWVEQLMASA